jgi:hypothetical protein
LASSKEDLLVIIVVGASDGLDEWQIGKGVRVFHSPFENVTAVQDETGTEVGEAVVRAAAMDQVGGSPQSPVVGPPFELRLDLPVPKDLLIRSDGQFGDHVLDHCLGIIASGVATAFDQGPERFDVHGREACQTGRPWHASRPQLPPPDRRQQMQWHTRRA